MGYRYGERKYSEGLYSRWPDWWRGRDCQTDAWTAQACQERAWTPAGPTAPAWTPLAATGRRKLVSAGLKAVGVP